MHRERFEQKELTQQKARELVLQKRGEKDQLRVKIQASLDKKKFDADLVKAESRKLSKIRGKHEKTYLRRAQEKRFEQQVMMEASKIKNE